LSAARGVELGLLRPRLKIELTQAALGARDEGVLDGGRRGGAVVDCLEAGVRVGALTVLAPYRLVEVGIGGSDESRQSRVEVAQPAELDREDFALLRKLGVELDRRRRRPLDELA